MTEIPDSAKWHSLSVALIVPDAKRRGALRDAMTGSRAAIVRELSDYPLTAGDLDGLDCDVVVVDLDDNIGRAVTFIEDICSRYPLATVMACSAKNESTLLRRSMQAGAREFLIEPFLAEALAEAFTRALARRPREKKGAGKMLVFVPAKGGVGSSTLSTNFAMALNRESAARVVIVDMDFQLGEVALGLGMTATFSVVDALKSIDRLDWDLLSTMLIRHRSGLAVLASPEEYSFFQLSSHEAATRLFAILREEFDYVVVDGGTCHGHLQEALFEMADKVYLVTELTLPALRNAHRLISCFPGSDGNRRLEIVMNRFNSRHGDIDEASAAKAMGRPVNWRVPNGYAVARAAQDNGVPLALESSPITKALVQMARAACGKATGGDKKGGGGFSLFGSRHLTETAEA